MTLLVLDTNVVLDAFVFADPATLPLCAALDAGAPWIATAEMREELLRVLAYPQIARRLAFHGRTADEVLARYDALVQWRDVAPRAPVRCGDEDDQKFIDLAVAHGALLVSKDREVLKMRKRMEKLGCPPVVKAYAPVSPASPAAA